MSVSSPNSPLLDSIAWDSCVDTSLLRQIDDWENSHEFRAHGHVLRRLFTDLHVDAILSVQGRPSVCIKDARSLSATEIESLRRQLWNLGATTLLVAEGKTEINVFSTMMKPASSAPEGRQSQLSAETIQDLQAVHLALQVRRFIHRVETGAIYRDHKAMFSAEGAVDRTLLENLRELRNLIAKERTQEAYRQAHALLGRFLFSCYLLDRRIIRSSYLRNVGLPPADDMLTLLQQTPSSESKSLATLFKSLQKDFNGSLFGNQIDEHEITASDITCLQRFLSGEDLRSGQLSFFKLYDFGFIPVELISSIYEEFLGAEATVETNDDGSAHSQRQQGAYYTPPRLAELTVDIATEGWTTLLDKKCFDPACGSGVFLVILFVRMAEEWRKRNPKATTRQRYDELMRLLAENLHGTDIHPTACLVTCFSLYLAFLDQMEPKEVIELKEALERDTKEKILPRMLWEANKGRPRDPNFATVRELDFFAMPPVREFDLVVGNPPWVSRKDAPSAEEWVTSDRKNPYSASVAVPSRRKTFFPSRELACAFMWKAALHVVPGGRVCQILPSRVFLSNNTDAFQSLWLQHHRLESLWLLADWRFILFPTADCPCFVGRYRAREPKEELADFDFVTPKVELLDPREALIPVLPEDQKTLSEKWIVEAAKKGEAAAAWKREHWGTPRDVQLLDRLTRFPRLSKLAQRPPSDSNARSLRKDRQWFKGQGFQPTSASTTDPAPVFWKKSDLYLPASAPVSDLVLLKEDCSPIGNRYREEGLHRPRSPLLYKAPLLLINKGCTKFLFSSFDVLFQDDFQSICAPSWEEDELLFLTAVLSSPLTQYLLFHTTANIGIERDIARLEEILELPFPLPEDLPDTGKAKEIIQACADRMRQLSSDLSEPENLLQRDLLISSAKSELEKFVYKYFDICDWESYLIRDTVELLRPSSTPRSIDAANFLTARPSRPAHRREYAAALLKTFKGWTRAKRKLSAACSVSERLGLALLTLTLAPMEKAYSEAIEDDEVFQIIDAIRHSTIDHEGVVFSRLRGFVLYEGDCVHILKPLHRRHWTRTAALNDADEILSRMMEESSWQD